MKKILVTIAIFNFFALTNAGDFASTKAAIEKVNFEELYKTAVIKDSCFWTTFNPEAAKNVSLKSWLCEEALKNIVPKSLENFDGPQKKELKNLIDTNKSTKWNKLHRKRNLHATYGFLSVLLSLGTLIYTERNETSNMVLAGYAILATLGIYCTAKYDAILRPVAALEEKLSTLEEACGNFNN